MSDLADLAADMTRDLPAAVRKVIDAAIAGGWQLGKPGMSVALRLSHPTDELAMPVYIAWTIGRTPKGAVSWRFASCSTNGLNSMSPADVLEYLADPTVVYPDGSQDDPGDPENGAKWNPEASAEQNLCASLGAKVIPPPPVPLRVGKQQGSPPSRASAPPLRV